MRPSLFFFVQKPDAVGKLGFSPQVESIAALHQLWGRDTRRSELRIFKYCRKHRSRGIGTGLNTSAH
ncbi:cystathionine beta-lyase [Pyrus ussuriensis x Pyrus communis]|uniref:Cystathionine beta-lyase n=1 Tax=Pyrus ussuriensis x Pyrus communis TaxID=2448454 RepID=A0A5N5FZ56_9ROSA|nr:cystathionine beta-lyase [Pyrus ussuriensis x Pyrus communis]